MKQYPEQPITEVMRKPPLSKKQQKRHPYVKIAEKRQRCMQSRRKFTHNDNLLMLKAWQHWSCGASPASPSPSWLSWATWSSCSRWMCWMRRMILRGGINTLKWCYSCAVCVDSPYSMSVSGLFIFNKSWNYDHISPRHTILIVLTLTNQSCFHNWSG